MLNCLPTFISCTKTKKVFTILCFIIIIISPLQFTAGPMSRDGEAYASPISRHLAQSSATCTQLYSNILK
jgi:hypothetical protein